MELQVINRNSSIMRIPLIKGIIITVWGVLALLLSQSSPYFLIKAFGILNLITGIMTMVFTFKHPQLKISQQWVLLEAVIELAAGVIFTFFINEASTFMYYVSIGILFIIILQFIYGYVLLNTGEFNLVNIFMRFLTLIGGIVIGVVIFSQVVSIYTAFLIIGAFSIVYGIINIQFGLSLNNAVLGHVK